MSLFERTAEIQPDRPVLVVGLEGYVDAGGAGATAMGSLLGQFPTELVARFDSDHLIDRRARRPIVRIVDGVIENVTWSEVQLRHGADDAGNDLLILVGPEPDFAWGRFISSVVELAQEMGVRLVIGLGAFPAPVPHTRAVRLSATATSSELAARIGFMPRTIDVPASAQTVLAAAMGEAGIPAVGLWARVPHYAAAMPYPGASVALLEAFEDMTGIKVTVTDLAAAAQETRERIDQLIANSDEHAALVRQLERQVDAEQRSPFGPGELPSGDEIANELERFLRGELG